jgi:hypothetical protein
MLHVKQAKHRKDFEIWVSFDDGTSGVVDLGGKLKGPVFEPLNDPEYFARLSVDPELDTIVWPNGADLAPEFLKRHITKG